MHRLRLGLFLSIVAAGCSNVNPPTVNSQRSPIVGGAQTQVGDFPTVVAILETQVGSLCTGTLISPNTVLTAAHCIDPVELGRSAAQVKAETFVIFDVVDLNNASQNDLKPVNNVIENPNHPNFSSQNPDLGHDDDALLILKTPKTDRLPSPVDLDDSIANKNGTATTQVGYGISNVNDQNSAGVEFAVNNKVVASCGDVQDDANLICFDQTDGKGQCNGDSGGPAFDDQGIVIGVVSFGDQNCTQFGADTRPSQTAAFIKANVPQLQDGTCDSDGVCNLSCSSDPDCNGVMPPPNNPVCGNGVKETGEQCDHGSKNGTSGDTCSATCKTVNVGGGGTCGDGNVDTGEECDNGADNGKAGNSCSSDCMDVSSGSNGGGDDDGGGGGCQSTSGTGGAFAFGLGIVALGISRRRRSR